MVSHRTLALTLFVLLVLTAALLTPPPTGPVQPVEAAKSCRSCHKSYDPLSITVAAPGQVGVNLTDDLQVELGVPWKHEARDVQVTLELPEGAGARLAPGEPTNRTINSIPKHTSTALSWKVAGVAPDTVNVNVTIDSTSYYKHKKSNKPNSQAEHFTGQVTLQVADLKLGVSPSVIFGDPARARNYTLELTSGIPSGNLTAFTLEGVGDLALFVNVSVIPATVSPGTTAVVNLTLEAGHPVGQLRLAYLLPDGTPTNTSVAVLVPASQPIPIAKDSGYFLGVGALYGWLAVAAMVAAMVQGFAKRWLDRRYMEAFKSARKEKEEWVREEPGERQGYWWWLHTLILFVLILFIYVHVIGAFRGGFPVEYDWPTVAGIIAVAILLAVGLSGLWPKKMKQFFGTKGWKKFHALLSAITLGLGLLHGILLRNVFFT